jgi:hypothetical protein
MASLHTGLVLSHKEAYEQLMTAQLMLWHTRIQLAWREGRATAGVAGILDRAWKSLDRFKSVPEDDARARELKRDVDAAVQDMQVALHR